MLICFYITNSIHFCSSGIWVLDTSSVCSKVTGFVMQPLSSLLSYQLSKKDVCSLLCCKYCIVFQSNGETLVTIVIDYHICTSGKSLVSVNDTQRIYLYLRLPYSVTNKRLLLPYDFLLQHWVRSEQYKHGMVWSPSNQPCVKSPLHKRGSRMASGIMANCCLNWNRIIHNLLLCQVQWEVKKKLKGRKK